MRSVYHTWDTCALGRGRHADRAAAALRPVHGRERVVSLLLISKPDETEALGRTGHGVGHHLRPQHGRVRLVLEGLLEVGICDLGRQIADKDGILWRLFYALAAGAPVQAVAQGGALCVGKGVGRGLRWCG